MILLLYFASTLFIVIVSAIIVLLGIRPSDHESLGFVEAFWMSLMRTLDPGTMGEDSGWTFRIFMLLVTSYGIVMLSTFIGLISNGIFSQLNTLRKGRSKVLEKDHVLILGWSPKINTIISELVIANENVENPVIVIMANRGKVEMEDKIRDKIGNTQNTRVVVRNGDPIDPADLAIVNPRTSKSIIILGRKGKHSDSETIKIILALTTDRQKDSNYHITAEIKDEKNLEVAKMVGKDEVELILTDDFISRIMVQTSRQSGLSVVYTDLMDFAGDEIYFVEEPKLVGKTFREALFSYEDSAVIGIQHTDGSVRLNPPADTVFQKGEKVIGITEDDDTLIINANPDRKIQNGSLIEGVYTKNTQENVLILGWNFRSGIIIRELNNYLLPGSRIEIIANVKEPSKTLESLREHCKNVIIEFTHADTTDLAILQDIRFDDYAHLMLLSYQDQFDIQEADAFTLITLLHLRNLSEKAGHKLNIVSEMLDLKNRELAQATDADDFIVSDNLISLLMSQVSENKYLMRVFEILFDAEDVEIYLKPASYYVKTGEEVSFYEVLESAVKKNEVAIGYRQLALARDVDKNYGIVLNPAKSEKFTLSDEDRVIVLAQD